MFLVIIFVRVRFAARSTIITWIIPYWYNIWINLCFWSPFVYWISFTILMKCFHMSYISASNTIILFTNVAPFVFIEFLSRMVCWFSFTIFVYCFHVLPITISTRIISVANCTPCISTIPSINFCLYRIDNWKMLDLFPFHTCMKFADVPIVSVGISNT